LIALCAPCWIIRSASSGSVTPSDQPGCRPSITARISVVPSSLTPAAVRGLRTLGCTRAVAPVFTPFGDQQRPGSLSVVDPPTPATASTTPARSAVANRPAARRAVGAEDDRRVGLAPERAHGGDRPSVGHAQPDDVRPVVRERAVEVRVDREDRLRALAPHVGPHAFRLDALIGGAGLGHHDLDTRIAQVDRRDEPARPPALLLRVDLGDRDRQLAIPATARRREHARSARSTEDLARSASCLSYRADLRLAGSRPFVGPSCRQSADPINLAASVGS
jgi:hypothetical protein